MTVPPVVTTIAETRRAVARVHQQGRTVALVPTMGALHEGHAELIRVAKREADVAVVSIFVNPTQFGPGEDLARYPRTLEADRELCHEAGANLIFHPTPEEMYQPGAATVVEVHALGEHLCGARRPGHFRGVATVVLKLLNIVRPEVAVFGAKDAQQARVIRQMVRDLDVPVEVRVAPTVREADGLALSSRNRYLSADERSVAPGIYATLLETQRRRNADRSAGVAELEAALRRDLEALPGAGVDYASIVDDETLQPVTSIDRPALCAVAVFLGRTRLIDNLTLS